MYPEFYNYKLELHAPIKALCVHNTNITLVPLFSRPLSWMSTILLQTDFRDFNISEIYKAGSLGHGTAVSGHYDIDLVIYSRGNCSYNNNIL